MLGVVLAVTSIVCVAMVWRRPSRPLWPPLQRLTDPAEPITVCKETKEEQQETPHSLLRRDLLRNRRRDLKKEQSNLDDEGKPLYEKPVFSMGGSDDVTDFVDQPESADVDQSETVDVTDSVDQSETVDTVPTPTELTDENLKECTSTEPPQPTNTVVHDLEINKSLILSDDNSREDLEPPSIKEVKGQNSIENISSEKEDNLKDVKLEEALVVTSNGSNDETMEVVSVESPALHTTVLPTCDTKPDTESSRPRRVLFVIAHPDDECMFFGPTVMHFTEEKALVYLVCLTNGSYVSAEEGDTRQQELWASCAVLGIPRDHVTLYRCGHFPDSPTAKWPLVTTANIISRHVDALDIDLLVTFDQGGVSGHANHTATYRSVLHLVEEQRLPRTAVYTLDTVNLLRKYCPPLDLLLTTLLDTTVVVSPKRHRQCIVGAMRAHASQYVLFRRVYMLCSRYTRRNTLTRIHPC